MERSNAREIFAQATYFQNFLSREICGRRDARTLKIRQFFGRMKRFILKILRIFLNQAFVHTQLPSSHNASWHHEHSTGQHHANDDFAYQRTVTRGEGIEQQCDQHRANHGHAAKR